MRLNFQSEAVHTNRAAHPLLTIQRITSGNHMQHFTVMRNSNRPRRFHRQTQQCCGAQTRANEQKLVIQAAPQRNPMPPESALTAIKPDG